MPHEAIPAVLLYPCNVMGYIRLLLLMGAAVVHHRFIVGAEGSEILLLDEATTKHVTVIMIGLSLLLDAFDGHVARKYDHDSLFGAHLDLLLDLITHALVWSLSGLSFSLVVIIFEWTCGLLVASFMQHPSGSEWKKRLQTSGYGLLECYFRNHQQNIFSAYGNISHFVFPIALYLNVTDEYRWIYFVTLPGLLLYEIVTAYMIKALLTELVYMDSPKSESRKSR